MENQTNNKEGFESWLSEPPRLSRARCRTCRDHPQVVEDVKRYLDLRRRRETRKEIPELHEFLQRNHGYDLKIGALFRHIRVCEGSVEGRGQ